MTGKTKPAIRSLGVWGNLTSIIGLVAVIRELIATHPQLIDDTQAWFAAAALLVTQLIALVGRWRAVTKISGIFK